jgi:hypothetical protein
MKWANDMILENINEPLKQYYVSGVLTSLVETFKLGQRKDLLDKIQYLIPLLEDPNKQEDSDEDDDKEN